MPDKEIMDPSTPSMAWQMMSPAWAKVQTLLDGTGAMRSAGETYMPKHENESPAAYEDRLHSAVLKNETARTLDAWVGRPFSDPVTISEDIPEDSELREWLADIDLQGNDIGVFARTMFKQGLAKAMTHVLIDFPESAQSADGERQRTLADDDAEGLRPYFSEIEPENLIFAEAAMVNGKEVLTHVRIRERETIRVGFSEQFIDRIRVFDRVIPGFTGAPMGIERVLSGDDEIDSRLLFGENMEGGTFVSVWRHHPDKKEDEEWELEEPPRRIGINRVPVVTFYSDRQGLMRGKSPLEDLADLNIRHWQSNSDQINVLTVSRFPLLSATGVDHESDVLEIGPKRMLAAASERAKFGYVEHSGAAINAGRQELLDLESSMESYGAEFLTKTSGNVTATARALDSAEASTPIQDAVVRFNDALQSCVEILVEWVGGEVPQNAVTVPVDFGPEEIVQGDLDSLDKARAGRDLSRRNYLKELHRRGVLADDFDFDENNKEVEEELAAFTTDFGTTDGEDIDPLAEE